MPDIECPYCDAGQNINHDDGFGFEEGVWHEMECSECEKNFVFETSISLHYDAKIADCLNGSPHDLRDTKMPDGKVIVTRCTVCDFEAHGDAIVKAHADAANLGD